MKLSNYLDPKLIFVAIEATTKEQAIERLIDNAAKFDRNFARRQSDIRAAVLEREEMISTVMENGIALPHARIEGYNDVIVVVGILKETLECEMATKEMGPLKVLFLIVVGKTKNQIMLKLMASISKLAGRRELLDAIAGENNPDTIFTLVKDAKIGMKASISAEDIMNTTIQPASMDNTLVEIAKRLVTENMVGLPVVDEQGRFLGEITERELIQYGLPKYTSVMKDLSFMTVGEPFEAYFKHESHVTVRELYRNNPLTVDRQAPIMEISFIMVTKGNTRIYVVEDGRYLGMIMRGDIIKKVLHI